MFLIELRVLKEDNENPVRIKACLNQELSDHLRWQLGTMKSFHFLKDFFEDLSRYSRDSDISCFKPGIGGLCINWNIKKDLNAGSVISELRKGVDYLNRKKKISIWINIELTTPCIFILGTWVLMPFFFP